MNNVELVTNGHGKTMMSEDDYIVLEDGSRLPMTDTEKAIIHKLLPLRFWDKVEVVRFATACRRVHGAKTVAEVVDLCGRVDVDDLIESAPRIKAVGGGSFGVTE